MVGHVLAFDSPGRQLTVGSFRITLRGGETPALRVITLRGGDTPAPRVIAGVQNQTSPPPRAHDPCPPKQSMESRR